MIFLTLRSGGGGSLTRRNVLLLLRVRGITVSRIGCRFGAVSVGGADIRVSCSFADPE